MKRCQVPFGRRPRAGSTRCGTRASRSCRWSGPGVRNCERRPQRRGRAASAAAMPGGTSGSSEKSASASNTSARSPFKRSSCGSRRVPISSASARIGADVRQRRHARPQLAEEARSCCGGTAAAAGSSSDRRAPRVGGPSEIVSWMNGRATARQRGERGVQVHEQRRLLLGHRRHLGGGAAERPEEAGELRLRVGQVARHRLEVAQQRPNAVDRLVEVLPAPRQAAAEAVERVALSRRAPCRRTC